MHRILYFVPFVAVLALSGGCGSGGSKAESTMKDMISTLDEMSATMEKAASVKEAKPKLDSLASKFKELDKTAKGLKVSKAEDEALKTKYEPVLKKSMEQFTTALTTLITKDAAGAAELTAILGGIDK